METKNQDAEQQIIESAPQILLETTEEFLRTFTLSNFSDNTKIAEYKNIMNTAKQIGSHSTFGTIYDMSDGNVLKVMKMCPKGTDMTGEPPIVQELCVAAREDSIILRIPNTQTGKLTVLLPQYLSEVIAGTLLRKMSVYTPSFMKILDFQYDPTDEYTMYMVQEKLEPFDTKVKNIDDFLIMVFQICHALSVAQKTSRFTHYDLHGGNVMIRSRPDKKKYSYELGNGLYFHLEQDWEAVIIDYGYNRMETKDSVIWPSRIFRAPGEARDLVDRHDYNPYYDIFFFLHAFRHLDSEQKYVDIMKMLVKTDNTKFAYNVFNKWLAPGGSRPLPERFSIPWTDPETNVTFTGACNATEMSSKLANYLSNSINYNPHLKEGYKVYPNPIDIMDHSTLQYNIFSKHRQPDLKIGNGIHVGTYSLDDLDIVFPVGYQIRTAYNQLNIVPSGFKQVHKDLSKQLVHITQIDTDTVLKNGFRFSLDCCRMDIRNFMQDNHIDGGVAINGGLFIKDMFLPVGGFQTGDFSSQIPIPPDYLRYYGIVAIDHDNRLVVDNMGSTTDYPTVLTTAPTLVENGVISNIDLQDPLFTGANNPGELRDGREIIARSAIGILANNQVVMVHVEGLTHDAAGMDLQQLSQLMVGLGCVDAVGLGGGSNSGMVFKKVGQNIINLVESRTHAHLVSNIISCTKRI
tara:strand:- start:3791 stop:5851 length:2061 start_codon:yes stop_codon:yes gene_type:complete